VRDLDQHHHSCATCKSMFRIEYSENHTTSGLYDGGGLDRLIGVISVGV
jgi:hypothetical protein